MVGPILEALERKIELRRDATRAPLRAPEWQRATSMPRPPRNTQISTRPRLTYCGPKLVLTKGSTLLSQIRALLLRQTGTAPQPVQPSRRSPAVKLDLTGALPLGSPNAPLTIVEFTDYQCPFCNLFYREVFKELKKNFIDSGRVSFYSRDLPLEIHPNATQTAHAGRCAADQNQFWAMRERMSANPTNLDMSTLLTYVREMSM